jgi:hypothetical protein
MLLEHCLRTDKSLSLAEYAAQLPPVDVLVSQYGVNPGIAWGLWRPVVLALEPELMATLEVSRHVSNMVFSVTNASTNYDTCIIASGDNLLAHRQVLLHSSMC